MGETLTFDARNNLIQIRAWGYNPIDEWIRDRDEIIRLHGQHGVNRVLVDATEQVTAPSLLDIFDFGENWPTDIRVAIVIGKNTPEDVLFLETAASQRGKSIHVFFDQDEALSWLDAVVQQA